MRRILAFTLVELLVVITIIVVLLALLAPAMDQAIYQAELAVCGARLHAIASGTNTYAMDNKRMYPYRPTLVEGTRWKRPLSIATQQAKDDRPYLRQAYGSNLNQTLLDPLCGKINLDHNYPPVDTNANYSLWFGMGYPSAAGGGKSLRRLGDRLEWTDNSRNDSASLESFSVIASDLDVHYQLPGTFQVLASHPDSDAMLYLFRYESSSPSPIKSNLGVTQMGVLSSQSEGFVLSWWANINATHLRGTLDTNYAFTDGSVERYNAVEWDDERMARVPWDTNAGSWNDGAPDQWHHLPRR